MTIKNSIIWCDNLHCDNYLHVIYPQDWGIPDYDPCVFLAVGSGIDVRHYCSQDCSNADGGYKPSALAAHGWDLYDTNPTDKQRGIECTVPWQSRLKALRNVVPFVLTSSKLPDQETRLWTLRINADDLLKATGFVDKLPSMAYDDIPGALLGSGNKYGVTSLTDAINDDGSFCLEYSFTTAAGTTFIKDLSGFYGEFDYSDYVDTGGNLQSASTSRGAWQIIPGTFSKYRSVKP